MEGRDRPVRILLTGPPRSGKTSEAARLFRERSGSPVGARGLALLPDAGAVEQFRLLVAGGSERGGCFDDGITTFEEYAARLLGVDREELTLPEEESLLLFAIRSRLPSPPAERIAAPGYRGALLQWIADLREALIDAPAMDDLLAVLEGPQPRLRALRDFARAFHRAARRRSFRFRSLLPAEAARRIEEDDLPGPPLALLVVDGFHRFSPVRLAFLEALAKRIPEVLITLPSADGEEEWSDEAIAMAASSLAELFDLTEEKLEAPPSRRAVVFMGGASREEEIERIGREIVKSCADEGRAPGDHAILFRSIGSYREAVESVFRRFAIPYTARFQVPLASSGAGRSLLDMTGLVTEGVSRSALEPIVKNRIFGAAVDRADEVIGRWRRLPAPGDPAFPDRDADVFERGFLSESVEPFIRMARDARALRGGDVVRLLRETWRELIGAFPPVDRLLPRDAALLGASIARADLLLERSARLFDDLPALRRLAAARVCSLLADEIHRARFSFLSGDGGGVRIDDYRHGENLSLPVVFLAGLSHDAVPRPWRPGSFWNDTDRERLGETGQFRIPCRASHRAEERFLFRRAFTRASDIVYLSMRAFDSAGRELTESPFREEIRESEQARPLDDRRLLERFDHVDSMARPADVLPFIARSIESSRRRSADLSLAAALVDCLGLVPPPRPRDFRDTVNLGALREFRAWAGGKSRFSVSELEEYRTCPWRYLSRHVLRLADREETPEFAFSPSVEGEVMHAVLEEVLRDGGGIDGKITARFESARSGFPERPAHRLAREELRSALHELLAQDGLFRRRSGWTVRDVEVRFGGDSGNGVKAGTILLGGRIDRIDTVKKDGSAVVVIDYKRTAPSPRALSAALESGAHLALPIYLLAAKAHAAADAVGAFLLGVRSGGRVGFVRRSAVDAGRFSEEDLDRRKISVLKDDRFDALTAYALKEAVRIARSAVKGSFPVEPADADTCAKLTCPFGDFCRVVLAAREEKK